MATVKEHDFVFVPTLTSPDGSPIVCHCLQVSERQILHALAAGASSVADVIAVTQAGTGCTACRVRIHQYVMAYRAGTTVAPADTICGGRCESCPRRAG